ncbi:MAG: 6-phosphofructokinase [Bacilli bacterium]|nr:6-phosphofructokinase [Bacilli bacterium]
MAKKAMVYIQSGGPTSVINSSLYGAIKEAQAHPEEISHIYGSLHGIEGLLCDELIDLGQEDEKTIELLKQTPGSILGTSRHKLPKDYHDKEYQAIIDTLRKHNIGYVFVNGGNDSMDTCAKLSALCKELNLDIKVMGVPKTVDNDLAETDHSNGFGSAAKYIINTVKEICIDASCYKNGKVFIIEIMGRNAGWLTAAVDLLPKETRPDFIYLPENKFDLEKFLKDIKAKFDQKGYVIAAISEGIEFERDESNVRIDSFGHKQLGGAAADLAKIVDERLDLKTRSIELSLPQRAYSFLTSKVDQDETIMCGRLAVQKALEGMSGHMIAIKRVSSNPYKASFEPVDITKIANVERKVPTSMMKDDTCMNASFREYCLPLIQGEINIEYENGIIKSAVLKKVRVK